MNFTIVLKILSEKLISLALTGIKFEMKEKPYEQKQAFETLNKFNTQHYRLVLPVYFLPRWIDTDVIKSHSSFLYYCGNITGELICISISI